MVGAQFFLDGREYSEFLSAYRWALVQSTVDKTRLKCPTFHRDHIVGLMGGSIGYTGDLPEGQDDALYMLNKTLNSGRNARTIMLAPYGAQPGYFALLGHSLRSSSEMGVEIEGIMSLNAEFEITAASPGVRFGQILFTPNAAGTITLHERWRININQADPNQFFGFRAAGTSPVAQFQLGTYATDAALRAGVKALLEGLAAYTGKTVTVATYQAITTNTVNGIALVSSILDVEWNSDVNVPNLEIVSGPVQNLGITGGDGGNYSFNGGATFTLPQTEAQIQSNQRALTGQYAAVVSKGSSNAASIGKLTISQIIDFQGGQTHNQLFDGLTSGTAVNVSTVGGVPYFDVLTASATTPAGIRFFLSNRTGTGSPVQIVISKYNGSTYDAVTTKAVTNTDIGTWVTVPFSGQTGSRWRVGTSDGSQPMSFTEVEVLSGVNVAAAGAFKNYFPVAATPAAPSKTGTGATATVAITGGSVATTITSAVTQEGGTLDGANVVSGVINGPRVTDANAVISPGSVTNKGLIAVLQPTYVSIGGSSTWVIQRETSANNWSDVLAFDPVTSNDAQYKEFPAGTDLQANMRIRCSAISGQCVVAAGYARKY